LVASDGADKVVGGPCLVQGGVLHLEFLAVMGNGAGMDNWIQRRFGGWDVEWGYISCKVKGRVLEQSQLALVVSPRAGGSHQVSSEFAHDCFELLMPWFPLDMRQDGMWHLGLDTFGRHSIGHGCSI
jgi:hypothetical protein